MTCDSTIGRRLAALDTCSLSDALDRVSLDGSLGGFERRGPPRRIAGRVITVALAPGPAPAGAPHLGTRALAAAGRDDVVLVANAGRTEGACWGGLLTLEAHLRGVAGVVLDGLLRDADEVEALAVSVFARGTTPRTARGRFHETATNVRVELDGVRIEPGDWVVADGSGVVFIAQDVVADIVSSAEELSTAEHRMVAALLSGSPGVEAMDNRYERMLEDGP